jgi:nucleoside-diphosphate-sugar epimerase
MRRLLIVGCGDIGLRLAHMVRGRWRVYALSRSDRHHNALRAVGATPVVADLDRPETLERHAGLAHDVIHLVPPPSTGLRDTRTANLVRALAKGGSIPQRLVYMSTSGVYGDCAGAVVPETRPTMPMSPRARRRADAERVLRAWGAESGTHVTVLRVPGIYASERLPIARLQSGTPALQADQDAYTNHIHADDLARIVMAALSRGRGGRTYNASDDSSMKMGDYFDLVADRFGLPHPPRVSWERAQESVPETLLSFMRESRRLSNLRLKKELRVRLRYPSVHEGIAAAQST